MISIENEGAGYKIKFSNPGSGMRGFNLKAHNPTAKKLIWLEFLEGSGLTLLKIGEDCSMVLSSRDIFYAQEIIRRVNGWEKVTELLKRCSGFFNTLKAPPIIALTGVQLWKEIEQALTEAGEA